MDERLPDWNELLLKCNGDLKQLQRLTNELIQTKVAKKLFDTEECKTRLVHEIQVSANTRLRHLNKNEQIRFLVECIAIALDVPVERIVAPASSSSAASAAVAKVPAAAEDDDSVGAASSAAAAKQDDSESSDDEMLRGKRRLKFQMGFRERQSKMAKEAQQAPTETRLDTLAPAITRATVMPEQEVPKLDFALFRYVKSRAQEAKDSRDIYDTIRRFQEWKLVAADANEGMRLPYKTVKVHQIGLGMWRAATVSRFDTRIYRDHFKLLTATTATAPWITRAMHNLEAIDESKIESVVVACQVVPCGFAHKCVFCSGDIETDGPQRVTYSVSSPATHQDSIVCHLHGRCAVFLKLIEARCSHEFFTQTECITCV